MANYGKNIGIVPLTDSAGITQYFIPNKHYGVDIGWYKQRYCNVLAWQDGTVVAKGYYSDTGYWVALEHVYDSKKRWTCYIHLKESACVSTGQKVVLGQKIGIRGNSGKSTGEHLHLYLTSEISKSISFNFTNLKKYSIDPLPYLYYSKQFNTVYISKAWTKALPAPIPDVVSPVSRDVTKDQLICLDDDLRVRKSPSLKADKIGHLEKGKYYNYYEVQEADGYSWYKIADNQWCACVDSVRVLPKQILHTVTAEDLQCNNLAKTLQNIANNYELSLEQLLELNPQLIKAGDILRVK